MEEKLKKLAEQIINKVNDCDNNYDAMEEIYDILESKVSLKE